MIDLFLMWLTGAALGAFTLWITYVVRPCPARMPDVRKWGLYFRWH